MGLTWMALDLPLALRTSICPKYIVRVRLTDFYISYCSKCPNNDTRTLTSTHMYTHTQTHTHTHTHTDTYTHTHTPTGKNNSHTRWRKMILRTTNKLKHRTFRQLKLKKMTKTRGHISASSL